MKCEQSMDAVRPQPIGSSLSEDPRGSDLAISDEEEEEEEEESLGITFTATETKCSELYEMGMAFALQGQPSRALESFLACLQKMQECQVFNKLPQTLNRLAQIYRDRCDYERAIEFAQAEKLFYEAVLIDHHNTSSGGVRKPDDHKISSSQHHPQEVGESNDIRARFTTLVDEEEDYTSLLISKAEEFNKLSLICSDEKQYRLALDYCGKAAKMYQSLYGPDHPLTLSTMERFTVLYAAVGRDQYAAAMQAAGMHTDASNIESNDRLVKNTTFNTKTSLRDMTRKTECITCENLTGSSANANTRPVPAGNSSSHFTPDDAGHLTNDTSKDFLASSMSPKEAPSLLLRSIPAWMLFAAAVLLIVVYM